MQIDIKEFEKCKTSKEFKANFISHPVPKPPIVSGPSEPSEPPKAPAWFRSFEERNNSRLDRIESTLVEHGKAITGLKTELTNVIKLNNLKH